MIPMKLTSEKPSGTMISCGSTAAAGVVAREAKSGALLDRHPEMSTAGPKEHAGKGSHDERRHVGDAAHERVDHLPVELRAVQRARLVDDGAYAARLDDAPYEERDAGNGRDDRF